MENFEKTDFFFFILDHNQRITPLQLHNEIQTNCEASRAGCLILLNLVLKQFQLG